jgi:hypothetical protein
MSEANSMELEAVKVQIFGEDGDWIVAIDLFGPDERIEYSFADRRDADCCYGEIVTELQVDPVAFLEALLTPECAGEGCRNLECFCDEEED